MSKSANRISKPTSLLAHNDAVSTISKQNMDSIEDQVNVHNHGIRSIEDYHFSKRSTNKANIPAKQIKDTKLKIKFSTKPSKVLKSKSSDIQCYMKKQWKRRKAQERDEYLKLK